MSRQFGFALLCACFIAMWPFYAHGQSAAPAAEVFIGGAKIWTHAPTNEFDTHGWGGSATGYFDRSVGVEADLFEYQGYAEEPPAWSNHYTLLFGPHFAYRRIEALAPFGHVLVGGTRGTQIIPPPYPPGLIEATASDLRGKNAFTLAAGGGLDVHAWRLVWIRVIQADYLHAWFPNSPQNSLRLSFGFTLHLGRLRSGGEK